MSRGQEADSAVSGQETVLLPNSYERHFGNIELQDLSVDSIINFAQIRLEPNELESSIKTSIDQKDLLYPLNVARLSYNELCDYIEFVNGTWKTQTTPEDFLHLAQADGRFNVIVAGHTRLNTIRSIISDNTSEPDVAANCTVRCSILRDNSVESIVDVQASENLHSNVSPEREAMAVVELYYYGLGTKWADTREFVTAQKKRGLNRLLVDEALTFASLEDWTRQQVFKGRMPYKAGVLLGHATSELQGLYAQQLGLTEDQPIPADTLDAVGARVYGAASLIIARRLKGTALKKYIQGVVEAARRETAVNIASQQDGSAPDLFDDEPLTLFTPAQQAAMQKRAAQRHVNTILSDINETPHAATTTFILEVMGLVDPEIQDATTKQLIADIEDSKEVLRQGLRQGLRQHTAGRAALSVVPDNQLFVEDEQLAM